MKKSNLSQENLKKIWSISCQTKKNCLTREDFFITLRLIALAQNGFPFTKKEIENNNPLPSLPKFSSNNNNNSANRQKINNNRINNQDNHNFNNEEEEDDDDESAYEIPEYNLNLYKKYFENNKDSQDNYISTKKAIEMWKSNTTSDLTIKKVANSLKPLEKNGFLNLKEFQVANHLLSICNCHEIPIPLPNCLLKFLGRPLNRNQPKKVKIKKYKNFNDYMNKNHINYNEQNVDYNSNEYYSNENSRKNSYPSTDIVKNRISEINEDEIKKFKSDEIDKNENNQNINDNNINKNSIDINENNNDLEKNLIKNNENNRDSINNNNNSIENNNINNFENKQDNNINNDDNIKNSKLRKYKTSLTKKNNNKDNNNILENIIQRMEELEKKNKDNNTQISFLISKINILQKEQQKINKEMNDLKNEFKKIISNSELNSNRNILQNLEKKPKTKSIIKYNNSLNILLNNEFSEDIQKEKNNFILSENQPNNNNKTYLKSFERVQRKIIIKRDDKNDLRKTFDNINNKSEPNNIQKSNKRDDIYENNSNKKLKRKKINTSIKTPIDENEKFPKNND